MNPAIPVNPASARPYREFKHTSPLIGCRFDPTGRFLFVSAQDQTLQRFDLLTGRRTALEGHKSWVRGLAFAGGSAIDSPPFDPQAIDRLRTTLMVSRANGPAMAALAGLDPRPITLVSGDYHGQMIWWDGSAAKPTPIRTVSAHDGWIRAVAADRTGKLFASCGNDHLVKTWHADGRPAAVFKGHESHVYNTAFHPDGEHLLSCDLKGIVKVWSLRTGAAVREFDAKILHKYDGGFRADIGGARGMIVNADGTRVAVCGITNVSNAFAGVGNPLVVTFDWKDGKAKQLKPKDAFQGTGWGVAFHADGTVIAGGGGSGGRIWFWKGDDPNSSHTVTVPVNTRDLALHPAGYLIACAGSNGSAAVYTIAAKAA